MKRPFAFALLSVAAVGGASSCLTWAQDPFGPALAPSRAVTRYNNQSRDIETVTIAGTQVERPIFRLDATENSVEEQKVDKLVADLKSADGKKKEELVAQLNAAIGEQFDRRQESKAKELKALEEQLVKLKEVHSKRTLQRDRIVGDRVKQILNEVEGLGWGTDTSDRLGAVRFPGLQPGPAVVRPFGTTADSSLGPLLTPAGKLPAAPAPAIAPAAPTVNF